MFARISVHADERRQSQVRPQAPIAQLDRASGYEPGGRTFESCWAHQLLQRLTASSAAACCATVDDFVDVASAAVFSARRTSSYTTRFGAASSLFTQTCQLEGLAVAICG